ncbi:kinase-like protein, partial [Decorospora gaudefroyi]
MNTLNQDHIVRFIAAFCRGTPEAPEYYLVTEWADGGNLLDFWKSNPNPPLTGSVLRAVIRQVRGLSDALHAVHYLRSNGCRHGDLKPANILWFGSGDEIGTLKIGDFGETKSHQTDTAMRNSNTMARYGTRRYEPPECEIGIGTAHLGRRDMRRSRLYDIWSFGCITLEIIIWLLYGTKGLREFNESVKTGFSDESPFYQVNQTGRIRSARVHNVVASWMEHISKDPACRAGTTALGDLLDLVERGLLVVKL